MFLMLNSTFYFSNKILLRFLYMNKNIKTKINKLIVASMAFAQHISFLRTFIAFSFLQKETQISHKFS